MIYFFVKNGGLGEINQIAHVNKNKDNITKLNKTKPMKDNTLVEGLISTLVHLTDHRCKGEITYS